MNATLESEEPVTEDRWMTRQEAADHLRVTAKQLDKYVKAGLIRRYTLPRSRTPRFKLDDVNALITRPEGSNGQ